MTETGVVESLVGEFDAVRNLIVFLPVAVRTEDDALLDLIEQAIRSSRRPSPLDRT